VTGTFDDWGKTQKLDKLSSGFFEKTVTLPSKDKVLYKVCWRLHEVCSS
jgi:hypothetical protein